VAGEEKRQQGSGDEQEDPGNGDRAQDWWLLERRRWVYGCDPHALIFLAKIQEGYSLMCILSSAGRHNATF
jgi:hypothetical protein